MPEMPDRLMPKSDQVAAKVMEGEAVIIDLATGAYYSMDGVGGLIWSLIEATQGMDDMVDAITAAYDVAPDTARSDLVRLAGQMLDENLVEAAGPGTPAGSIDPADPGEKKPYETPTLEIFRDMEELLALDPPMPGLKEQPGTGG